MIAVCIGITSVCCCYGRVGILASREIGSRVGLGRRRLRHIGLGSNWRGLHRVRLGRRRLGCVGLGRRRLGRVGLGR